MFKYYLFAYLGVLLTATSQVLMKKGSLGSKGRHWLRAYLNGPTITAYMLLLCTTLLNLYSYHVLPMKVSIIVLPVTTILVGVFSFLFFGERLARRQFLGVCLIVAGIALYNL